MLILRGLFRLVAAGTGSVLVFGIVYALEGMTTRVPMPLWKEMPIEVAFILPWAVLSASGFHDLAHRTRRESVFWAGIVLLLAFLYFMNRHTSDSIASKICVPLASCAIAALPHLVRRTLVVYSVISVFFGLFGLGLITWSVMAYMNHGGYPHGVIGALMTAFEVSSVGAGVLSVVMPIARKKESSLREGQA